MSVPETHYVLIVHGTWNAPEAGVTKWYQKGGAFAKALAERLEGTSLAGGVWRSCAGKSTDFAWCGDNTHECRLETAERLCEKMLGIHAADKTARIHLVAHSHGGNVVLKALELYFAKIARDADNIARRFTWRAAQLPDVAREEVLAAVVREVHPDWPQARCAALGDAIAEQLPSQHARPVRPASLGKPSSLFLFIRTVRLLGKPILFIRTVRQGIALEPTIRQWLRNDPQGHRIGRLVFLGTPFLRKRWHRHKLQAWLRRAIAGIAGIPFVAFVMYFGIVYLGALLALLPFIDFVGFNPLHWPRWMQAASLLGICLTAFRTTRVQQQDVNLYHAPPAGQDASAAPLPALIVTAAQLDEALLGLSAEPLVDAYLIPEIETLTALHLRWRLRDPQAGSEWSSLLAPEAWYGYRQIARSVSWLVLAGSNLTKLLAWPVYAATLRPLARTYLRRSIRRLMLAQASGLPPHEFNSASLVVRPDIGVPEVFDEGKVWDVAELIAGAPSLLPAAVEKERYAFLWSPDALRARLPQSRMWPRLDTQEYWSMLKRERGHSLDEEELLALKRACLVIEEKARELGGAVQLSHSGYYGDSEIVDAVARFLVSGKRPTDAEGQARGATSS